MQPYEQHPISRRHALGLIAGFGYLAANAAALFESPTVPNIPIVMTGFEPFQFARDWNSSTTIVRHFEEEYTDTGRRGQEMHFLTNLPVDNRDRGKAARAIEQYILTACPHGCIVLALGEDQGLTNDNSVIRVEHQSLYSPNVASTVPASELPTWQVDSLLYRHIVDDVTQHAREILETTPTLNISLPYGKDTAGGYICEQTLTALNELSYAQARAPKPYPLLPLFLHVPSLKKGAILPATVQIIKHISRLATDEFLRYQNTPTKFVTKLDPQEIATQQG